MPIYEYECGSCQCIIEELQKISDPPLEKCPHCGGGVSKLMSMNTFHLKGTGWYVTDYSRKNGPGASTKTDSGSTAAAKDTKSETKKTESTKSDT